MPFYLQINMAESRTLAAVSRQAGLAQGKMAELRRELLELEEEEGKAARASQWRVLPERGGRPEGDCEAGEEEEEAEEEGRGWSRGKPHGGGGLEGRVKVLAAALRHAEAARAQERVEGQAAMGALRKALGAVGEKAVEAARLQVRACVRACMYVLPHRASGLASFSWLFDARHRRSLHPPTIRAPPPPPPYQHLAHTHRRTLFSRWWGGWRSG
jgi:hypothetical protein